MCSKIENSHLPAQVADSCTLTATDAVSTPSVEQRLCQHCDLVVDVPELKAGQKASCPRCHTVVKRLEASDRAMPMVYAASALVMLVLALLFPFVTIRITGVFTQISINDVTDAMVSANYLSLALIFLGFVLLVPIFCLVSVLLLGFEVKLPLHVRRTLARYLFRLQPWCMAEIFLVGVLVSFVKLMAYGEIGLGLSFAPFCLFCLLQIKTFQSFDRRWIWHRIQQRPALPFALQSGQTGISQGVRLCRCCHAILNVEQPQCPRCYTYGYARNKQSLQWTMALLFTSMLLYIPANVLPIMITGALGNEYPSTILSGVLVLWQGGSYPVAMVIFFASIIIPSLKMLAIAGLCYYAHKAKQGKIESEHMHLVYEMVEFVGRWSMVDIFVIAVLAALVQMGNLMSVYPDVGALFFAAVVIMTMISAVMFDPRLLWDQSSVLINKKEVNSGRQ